MTTDDHMRPDLRYVLGLSDRERIAFMDRPTLLAYPAGNEILKQLQRLFEMPKRPRMGNLLIVGEPNNGKTTVIKKFYELHGKPTDDDEHGKPTDDEHGEASNDDAPSKPVVIVESPPTADEKSLHLSILDRFHAPYRTTGPVTELRYQALHLLRLCRTRMLIIDEFHSMLTGTARKQSEVMNTIKFLCNELQIPIVGVGTHVAVRALRSDQQHASRFRRAVLPLWKPDGDLRRLLVGFEETLPLKKRSGLADKKMTRQLHMVSKGNLGNLREGLVACARKAIEEGTEEITLDLIESMREWFRPTDGTLEHEPEDRNGQYP